MAWADPKAEGVPPARVRGLERCRRGARGESVPRRGSHSLCSDGPTPPASRIPQKSSLSTRSIAPGSSTSAPVIEAALRGETMIGREVAITFAGACGSASIGVVGARCHGGTALGAESRLTPVRRASGASPRNHWRCQTRARAHPRRRGRVELRARQGPRFPDGTRCDRKRARWARRRSCRGGRRGAAPMRATTHRAIPAGADRRARGRAASLRPSPAKQPHGGAGQGNSSRRASS
jgi:hypothetical protein